MKISEILQDNFGVEIDDVKVSKDTTWSSDKIQNEFTTLEDSSHAHKNKSELDKITDGKVASWDSKAEGSHTHAKSDITDLFKVENSLTSNSSTNALSVAQGKAIDNKVNTLRGEYDTTKSEVGTLKTDTSDLKGKAHTHSNKVELDKITSEKVESWDSKANATHTHKATEITQDATHKFVTDAEKNIWNNKVNKSNKHQVKLLTTNWVGSSAPYTYPITIQGMDADKNWEVTNSVEPLMTSTELDAFGRAKIVCGTQTTNTVNLIAYGKKPTTDINLLINVRGD